MVQVTTSVGPGIGELAKCACGYSDCPCYTYGVETTINGSNPIMSVTSDLIRSNMSAEDRFLTDQFLVDSNGALSTDGRTAFVNWLYSQGTAKADFVAAAKAAKKQVANDHVADRADVTADEAE